MSSKSAAAIEPGSLADRVCRWFGMASNRGEERTPGEIGKQFDCPQRVVVTQLEPAVSAHLLVFTQGSHAMVYQRGPQLAAWLGQGTLPTIAPAKKKRAPRLPDVDVAKLKVRRNVPVPAKRAKSKGLTRWDPIFDKLEAPGMSVLLERAYYAPIAKAVQAYLKRTGRKLVVRMVDEVNCGIWNVTE